jgi:hypothetical protein
VALTLYTSQALVASLSGAKTTATLSSPPSVPPVPPVPQSSSSSSAATASVPKPPPVTSASQVSPSVPQSDEVDQLRRQLATALSERDNFRQQLQSSDEANARVCVSYLEAPYYQQSEKNVVLCQLTVENENGTRRNTELSNEVRSVRQQNVQVNDAFITYILCSSFGSLIDSWPAKGNKQRDAFLSWPTNLSPSVSRSHR